jgi:hypothetical protein
MATAIKNFATETFVPAIKTTGENIQSGIAKIYGISTTIENSIHATRLPRPVATITCVFLRTLPFLIMFATCPPLLSLAVTGLFCTIKVIATKNTKNYKIQGAWAAAGLSALYAGIQMVKTAQLGLPLAFGLVFMAGGALVLGNSGVLCEILGSCPTKQKETTPDQKGEVEMKEMTSSETAQSVSDSAAPPQNGGEGEATDGTPQPVSDTAATPQNGGEGEAIEGTAEPVSDSAATPQNGDEGEATDPD